MNLPLSNLTWRKSSRSSANGSNCVEVASLPSGRTAVRDSQNPTGPMLTFTTDEWKAFITSIKNDEFNI